MEKLIIIDGNSIAYRAFYALPVLMNRKGTFTNAAFGFTNMFLKIVDSENPTHVAVVFDYPAKTFRNNLFKDYKATRKPMPSELVEQMPLIKQTLKTLGAYVIEKEGFEADDLIGSIAKKFDIPKKIITGDRDCLQLISPKTSVLLTKKGLTETVLMDETKFRQDYGFEPSGIIDLKSLMGDSSDNIPGVKGIGEKGAMALIQQYRTLDGVYEHLDEITGKNKTLLTAQKDMAYLSHELATINQDVPFEENLDDFKFSLKLGIEAKKIFEDLEFNILLKRKEILNLKEDRATEYETVVIKSLNDLAKIDELDGEIALLFRDDKIEIANSEKINYEILIKTDLLSEGFDFGELLNLLKGKFESKKIKKICFDVKKEKTFLNEFDIELNGCEFDVHIACWLLNSTANCDVEKNVFDLAGQGSISAASLFACCQFFRQKLKEEKLDKLYETMEFPLIDVLYGMERAGIKIDEKTLDEILVEFQNKEKALIDKIYSLAGFQFNVNSPKQLGEVLFDKLNLPANKKRSTSVEVLTEISTLHPIIPVILEYRTINKITSTYLLAFKEVIKNSFIHTTYNQTGTTTGRLSSTNPNLQNIPVRKEEGKLLRKMFVSRFENGEIISADYNQIELRLVANLSQDEKMINAFNSGFDIHRATASEIFGVPFEQVTAQQRQSAKAVNFGIIYGISAFGLSDSLGINTKEASQYIENYYKSYPQIKTYMQSIIDKAKENGGEVETIFGRKRKIKELFSNNYNLRMFGERAAMNMPFQGSSSDIIKLAMIKVASRLESEGFVAKLVLQIHDELIVDCPKNEVETVKKLLKEEMESVVKLSVPLTVDVESGKTWFDV